MRKKGSVVLKRNTSDNSFRNQVQFFNVYFREKTSVYIDRLQIQNVFYSSRRVALVILNSNYIVTNVLQSVIYSLK